MVLRTGDDGLGDIMLDGKRYKIDLATWREKDIIDFAPRATVPGGSVVMSDLNLYQPLLQTDWQHGMGFHWYSDASGYLYTEGSLDTRQDGLVMMMTEAFSSDTNANIKEGFCTFNGELYAWGAAGLRKYDGAAWSNVYTTAAVNFALPAGDYLFFCPNGLRIQKMTTGGVISNAGVDANATDYKWLIIHNGFIYAGKDGTNRVHYDSNADLSQLEGTTADPDVIYCGIGNIPTLGAIVYAGQLYVSRQDGLWIIGEDRIARRVIDHSGEVSANNFRGMSVMNGYLYYTVQDRMAQWNGARVSDVTPRKITDTYPYVTYGRFDNLVSHDNFLYLTARTNEGTYREHLLCFDGVGWHKLNNILDAGTPDTVSAMTYDVVNNRLWYHYTGSTNVTYYIQFQSGSAFPYASFPTSGEHYLVTSRLDMGFRRVKKSMPSMLFEARNCTATRFIGVYYQLDGDGTWVLWENIKTNGIIELTNPGGAETREFNYIQFLFLFINDDATQSPIMEGYTIRFIMRPDVLLGFNFYIIGSTNGQYETSEDQRSASIIRRDILRVRNSKAPVEFIDILGDKHTGYISTISGQPIYRIPAEGEIDEIEFRIQVNFVSMESFDA